MTEPVELTVWVDFLDPWSYVVAARVQQVAADYGDQVSLNWKCFMLRPESDELDLDEFRRSTTDWLDPAAAESELTFSLWSSKNDPPTHSAPALAAAKAVDQIGDDELSARFRTAVFEAYFEHSRTISDPDALLAVAKSVGFFEDDFAMRFRGAYAERVRDVIGEHNEGLARGIDAPPAVVIAGEFLVKGPAEVERYRALIDQHLAGPEARLSGSAAALAAKLLRRSDPAPDTTDPPDRSGSGAGEADDAAPPAESPAVRPPSDPNDPFDRSMVVLATAGTPVPGNEPRPIVTAPPAKAD